MKIILLLLSPLFLFAKVHYAKVEPYEQITLKSAVSAQVIKAKIELEGKQVKQDIIIKLDSKLDHSELKSSQTSLKLIKNMLKINHNILLALKESMLRQEGYYTRISNIGSASITQKDKAFTQYISTKTQYFSTQEKIDSLKKQRLDTLNRIEKLKDQISKKTIIVKNKFIYKMMVNRGDFVNMGTPLAQVKDLTQAKLVLFLEKDELQNIQQKIIYLDGKASTLKVSKIWSVADEKFISSYRTEIIIPNPKNSFSKLLKVEFK